MRGVWIFVVLFLVLTSSYVQPQEGTITEKLMVGPTPIAHGQLKIVESLLTRDRLRLIPGSYRVTVAINSLGDAVFLLSSLDAEGTASEPARNRALNTGKQIVPQTILRADIVRNILVQRIASNLKGTFTLSPITPSESLLSFTSDQFEATAILGRMMDTRLPDLTPTSVQIVNTVTCGASCVEGNIKIVVKNVGNSPAKGKWNVLLTGPSFYAGSVSDIGVGEERTVTSSAKLKLPCCVAQQVHAEIHPDFFNQQGIDADDSNNIRSFLLKLR